MASSREAADLVRELLRPEVLAMPAYHVSPSAGLRKLDAMENPYGWPEGLREQWLRRLATVQVNRYPDAGARILRRKLAAAWDLPDGARLLLGNGSDELIQLLVTAVNAPGRVLLVPDPSFSMYRIVARNLGMRCEVLALDPDTFALPETGMLDALERHRPALVFLATPNNPTGNRFDPALVERVIDAAPGLVVLDEAYAPFAGGSLMRLAGARANVLVLRTLSKMGLAGLRLGALAGPPAWLDELDKLRLPYNINALTQVTAELALDHYSLYMEQVERIKAERARLQQALGGCEGLRVWPSEANFLLVRVAGRGAYAASTLRERGILVKDLHVAGTPLEDCLRVTVGLPEDNDTLVRALRELLSAPAPARMAHAETRG